MQGSGPDLPLTPFSAAAQPAAGRLPVARAPGAALTRHILDDRCRTRDIFCPSSDPKAPIPFSDYLERQNRERPDRSDGPATPARAEPQPGPRSQALAAAAEPSSGTSDWPAAGRSTSAAAQLGDVFGTPPVSMERPRAEFTVHYELHRPLPSGMTIDVFA